MTRSGLTPAALKQDSRLAMLTTAEKMLAEARTIPDLQDLIDMAEVARVAAQESKLGSSAVNHATVIKIAAERRLADAVDEGQRRGQIAEQGKPSESERLATLSDLGIQAPRLNEARLLRDAFEETDLRNRAAAASEQDKILSRDRLLRLARDARAAETRDAELAAAPVLEDPDVDLRIGDFRDVLADVGDGTVNAVITDPPYEKAALPLYGDLAVLADRVLTPDGVLAVMVGQTHLPSAMAYLIAGRPYRWTMAYLTSGAGFVSHSAKVQSNWKPVLIFGGSRRFSDVVSSSGDDKRLHEWGQNADGFVALVERLTLPGALVCDPFLGAGTTALAARSLGRRFVGCDLDEGFVAKARQRLAL